MHSETQALETEPTTKAQTCKMPPGPRANLLSLLPSLLFGSPRDLLLEKDSLDQERLVRLADLLEQALSTAHYNATILKRVLAEVGITDDRPAEVDLHLELQRVLSKEGAPHAD